MEKAIETHQITRKDLDLIIHLATEDSFIDPMEKALLHHFNDMIEDKSIRVVKSI